MLFRSALVKPASPSASHTNRQPWLNCASPSPSAALCFTTSSTRASNSAERSGRAGIAGHVIHCTLFSRLLSQTTFCDAASEAISAGPYGGIFRLRPPVPKRADAHVKIRESGGSSRGSRLARRALGGIALRFASFLSRRHHIE